MCSTRLTLGGYLARRYSLRHQIRTQQATPESLLDWGHSGSARSRAEVTGSTATSESATDGELTDEGGLSAEASTVDQAGSQLETAQSALNAAERAYDGEEYEHALDRCGAADKKANAARRHALATGATDGTPSPYSKARQLVEDAQSLRIEIGSDKLATEREAVTDRLEHISDGLDQVAAYLTQQKLVEAVQLSAELRSKIDDISTQARDRGFQDRLNDVERRHEQLYQRAATTLEEDRSEAINTELTTANKALDNDAYDEALSACETAIERAEQAITTASTHELDCVTAFKTRRTEAKQLRDEVVATRERADVEATLDDISATRDHIETRLDNHPEEAFKHRFEVAKRLENLTAQTQEHELKPGVDQIEDRFEAVLSRARESFLTARIEQIETRLAEAKTQQSQHRYDAALNLLDEVLDIAEDTHATAEEYVPDRTDAVAELIAEHNRLRDEIKREQSAYNTLTERLDVIEDRLETVRETAETADHGAGVKQLNRIESELDAATEPADEHGFAAVYDRIEQLRTQHDTLRERAEGPAGSGLMSPETIPSPPQLALSYDDIDIGEHVGRGGNAEVYRATTTATDDRTVAVKQPRVTGSDTFRADTVQRLIDEARIWQRIDTYDHIVDVYDYGKQPLPWVAMEYMDGATSERVLRRCQPNRRSGQHSQSRGVYATLTGMGLSILISSHRTFYSDR